MRCIKRGYICVIRLSAALSRITGVWPRFATNWAIQLRSGTDLRESPADGLHEGNERLVPEFEADACRLEQLGQGPCAAEGQGAAIGGHRAGAIGQRLPPDLQGAQLRDPVLDV